MTPTDKWIDATYKELERNIKQQEDDFLDMFMEGYFADFFIDDTRLKNSSGNYAKVNEINKKFDEAYEAFIIPFLLFYGSKLIEAGQISLDYFKSIGVDAKSKDIAYLAGVMGISGNKIVKGSFLYNLGMMGEVRQRLQEQVMNAVSSAQKFSVFIRDVKPIFKSTKKQRSLLSKYYLKYAYNPIMQALNGSSYMLAQKYGMTHFRYEGGLVEKTRPFCLQRNGNEYSIEEGESWNQIDWSGKIDGVDFFVQAGGHFCRHHLEYLTKEDTNE